MLSEDEKDYKMDQALTDAPSTAQLIQEWTEEQNQIGAQVETRDIDHSWTVAVGENGRTIFSRPIFVAGADISFSTKEKNVAVATVSVIRVTSNVMHLAFSRSKRIRVETPYIPSFLAFREAPFIASFMRELPNCIRTSIDCLLIDGNGILHPRRAGLASHLGVVMGLPTIGVSKNLFCMDGLDEHKVREEIADSKEKSYDLRGKSGVVWGHGLLTGNAVNKPIYISVGHRMSLNKAVQVVKGLCKYRVPEPIRIADLHSREALRTGQCVDIFEEEVFRSIP